MLNKTLLFNPPHPDVEPADSNILLGFKIKGAAKGASGNCHALQSFKNGEHPLSECII